MRLSYVSPVTVLKHRHVFLPSVSLSKTVLTIHQSRVSFYSHMFKLSWMKILTLGLLRIRVILVIYEPLHSYCHLWNFWKWALAFSDVPREMMTFIPNLTQNLKLILFHLCQKFTNFISVTSRLFPTRSNVSEQFALNRALKMPKNCLPNTTDLGKTCPKAVLLSDTK